MTSDTRASVGRLLATVVTPASGPDRLLQPFSARRRFILAPSYTFVAALEAAGLREALLRSVDIFAGEIVLPCACSVGKNRPLWSSTLFRPPPRARARIAAPRRLLHGPLSRCVALSVFASREAGSRSLPDGFKSDGFEFGGYASVFGIKFLRPHWDVEVTAVHCAVRKDEEAQRRSRKLGRR